MKHFLVGIILLGLVGCTQEKPTSTPSETNQVASNSSVTPKDGSNSNRVFQLKELDVKSVEIKGKKFDLFVMDTEEKRREGLMFVEDGDLTESQGMIFAFKTVQKGNGQYGFWMHNTLIPLDIVYISPAGKVVQIFEAKSMDDTQLIPKGDYQTVIELKTGIAKKIGLVEGDTIKVSVPAKD
jgi:uncharacterized protein